MILCLPARQVVGLGVGAPRFPETGATILKMYTYLYLASFLLYLNINSALVSCNSGNHHPWCRASVRHQGCACGAQPFFCIIIIIIIITITIIIIIVSFLVTTSDDYNVNGYKAVSPIERLRRMDDDIMMPSHSTLWRKRSEVTKDIEDTALPLLLLLLDMGRYGSTTSLTWKYGTTTFLFFYYYFDMAIYGTTTASIRQDIAVLLLLLLQL